MQNYSARLPVLFICLLCAFFPASGSHIAGGGFLYQYLGDSMGYSQYKVTMTLYEDCFSGQPSAIAADNPAYLGVYVNTPPYSLYRADSPFYASSVGVPFTTSGPCGSANVTNGCILEKTFTMNYAFPPSSNGYIITYVRCCLNAAIADVSDPADNGVTYFCTIPPSNVAGYNNSAVFNNIPPFGFEVNTPLSVNLSATDPDGDSLSYELYPLINGATGDNSKPWPGQFPTGPPFDSITYLAPFSAANPVKCSAPLQLDPVTGILTGTPSQEGIYLMAVCCHEWRAGVLINNDIETFEVRVLPSSASSVYQPYGGGNVTVIVGDTYQFYASGAASYTWSPAAFLSNPNIGNPLGTFTEVGTFTYIISGVSDSGCRGSDTVVVTVLPYSEMIVPSAFTPNNDGLNDYLLPVSIGNCTLNSFKIFNRRGNLVFSMDGNYYGQGWDGTYKGKQQDMGAFYWEIQYQDSNGNTHRTKGDVTLIR